jgi:hypothetical protein
MKWVRAQHSEEKGSNPSDCGLVIVRGANRLHIIDEVIDVDLEGLRVGQEDQEVRSMSLRVDQFHES